MGKLWVVATPIGHAKDITQRAVEIFKSASVFVSEDTREIKHLLNILGLTLRGKKFLTYAKHNLHHSLPIILSELESAQSEVVLVTDRGTPAISDPGSGLVSAAREKGHLIVPIPGVSSVATLFSVSGCMSTSFYFQGFFPKKESELFSLLESFKKLAAPIVFFESPQRIYKTFASLQQFFPDGKVFVGREMTKEFESYFWCDLKTWKEGDFENKGEFSCLLMPHHSVVLDVPALLENEIEKRCMGDKAWSKHLASQLGLTSKEVYNALQKQKS